MWFFSRFITITGFILIGIGILLVWERNNPKRLSFHEYKVVKTTSAKNYPVRIQIKKANIDLPVIPSHIKNNTWETTNKGVSYLVSSPIPGTGGNSILYGHNWNNLLGPLTSVKPGDTIQITYQNGKTVSFFIKLIGEVNPNDTYILLPTKDTRITLYTCTGFMDSKRLVVTASPTTSHGI